MLAYGHWAEAAAGRSTGNSVSAACSGWSWSAPAASRSRISACAASPSLRRRGSLSPRPGSQCRPDDRGVRRASSLRARPSPRCRRSRRPPRTCAASGSRVSAPGRRAPEPAAGSGTHRAGTPGRNAQSRSCRRCPVDADVGSPRRDVEERASTGVARRSRPGDGVSTLIAQCAASAGAETSCLIRCTETTCQRTRGNFSPLGHATGWPHRSTGVRGTARARGRRRRWARG